MRLNGFVFKSIWIKKSYIDVQWAKRDTHLQDCFVSLKKPPKEHRDQFYQYDRQYDRGGKVTEGFTKLWINIPSLDYISRRSDKQDFAFCRNVRPTGDRNRMAFFKRVEA